MAKWETVAYQLLWAQAPWDSGGLPRSVERCPHHRQKAKSSRGTRCVWGGYYRGGGETWGGSGRGPLSSTAWCTSLFSSPEEETESQSLAQKPFCIASHHGPCG
jgi:hypothetical protein